MKPIILLLVKSTDGKGKEINMKEYVTPDFDVTVYEVEDVITASVNIDKDDPNEGGDWFG